MSMDSKKKKKKRRKKRHILPVVSLPGSWGGVLTVTTLNLSVGSLEKAPFYSFEAKADT
jgi:hypothetical protein